MNQDALLKKWDKAITKTKSLIKTIKDHQMEIAGIALSVCEITRGGNKKILDGKYTLKRFAQEVGVNHRTLSQWVAIRVRVFDKLPEYEKKNCRYTDLHDVCNEIPRDFTPEQAHKKYTHFIKTDTFERKIIRYVHELRSLHQNFGKQSAAFKVSNETLKEIIFYCSGILKYIEQDRPSIKVKKVPGKLSSRKRYSASKAVLGTI